MDEVRIPPAGDPFTAKPATYVQDQDEHACYSGLVYIGHMVEDDVGDEVVVYTPIPCRRCAPVR